MLQESMSSTNEIVTALSDTAHGQLQLTAKGQGSVLLEAGEKPLYVFFPVSCVVTLLHTLENGSAAGVSTVGQEGMVGVELLLSGQNALGSAVVSSSGHAYRLRADLFRRELAVNGMLRYALLRFAQGLMAQITQTAACNRHHTVSQQLCRWLLLSMDRTDSNHIAMTHELIAGMLGVRREGVTEAACKLQKLGVISYSRGHIEVLDRNRMESASCECYSVMRRATGNSLGSGVAPSRTAVPHVPRRNISISTPQRLSA